MPQPVHDVLDPAFAAEAEACSLAGARYREKPTGQRREVASRGANVRDLRTQSDLKLVLSHATGNQNVRQALRAFQDAGVLAEFCSCIAISESAPWMRWVPGGLRPEIRRRAFDQDVLGFARTHPYREAARLVAERIGVG